MSRTRRGRARRGYTILEVMIALTLITVGVSGVVAMQKVTSVSNREARDLAIANQIARTWIDRLRNDAIGWNIPSPSMPSGSDLDSDTVWLKNTGSVEGWFQPASDELRLASAAFDRHGTDLATLPEDEPAAFCTHLRLSWLYGPPTPPFLIRAEVRVFWLREGGGGLPTGMDTFCDEAADTTSLGSATQNFRFVYAATAIKQNPL